MASMKFELSPSDCLPAHSEANADDKFNTVVSFSPNPDGYLHIGDAEVLLINEYFQKEDKASTLIVVLDDTDSSKEDEALEKVILEDLEMLQIKYDRLVHTSDHFELIGAYCEQLLRQGKAYVDDTDPETMKQEREQRLESNNRINSVSTNLDLWEEMKNGTDLGKRCCVRAKICMTHHYLCMRDPVIYCCNSEPHNRTGNTFKIYPTNDFACPIVDNKEGVTVVRHRPSESYILNEQYYWFIEALGFSKPIITNFGNVPVSALSKCKLACFVQKGIVDGWDDPRIPTVRGLFRRGVTAEALKHMVAQGTSPFSIKANWDKIWKFNRNFIKPDVVPGFAALDRNSTALVFIKDQKEVKTSVLVNTKRPENGSKDVWLSDRILIELADVEKLEQSKNFTLKNWQNKMTILNVQRGSGGVRVEALRNWNAKKKEDRRNQILNWLAVTEKAKPVPCICVYFDQIIPRPTLATDEALEQCIKQQSKTEVMMLGELALANVNKGDVIQLHKRGFFICDSPYKPMSSDSCPESPIILFYIPDGKNNFK